MKGTKEGSPCYTKYHVLIHEKNKKYTDNGELMIIEENELFLFPAFSILNISEPNHSEEQGYI